jgi:hypothetical protein
MKIKTKNKLIAFSFVLIVAFIGCDNKSELNDIKKQNINETQAIEQERIKYQKDIDSINREIDLLSRAKNEIEERADFAEAEIFRILKSAYLDHIIIGSNNLDDSKNIFEEKLGFNIKDGKKHKNGISNIFIEFSNNSEIEFISVKNPSDNLANQYKKFLDNDRYGFQIALRTNEISNLKEHLTTLSLGYENFSENRNYSTLSTKNINSELPLFFIQYNEENKNTYTNHLNKSVGIKSIWFSTRNIKNTARELVDFGFDAVGNYELLEFKGKVVQFKNNNFGIILIESEKYELTGMTIWVEDLETLNEIIRKNKIEIIKQFKKKIFINPAQTKSIWIEFVEN